MRHACKRRLALLMFASEYRAESLYLDVVGFGEPCPTVFRRGANLPTSSEVAHLDDVVAGFGLEALENGHRGC